VTQLAHDAPNDPRWIGYQGLIAAHRGDTTSARRAERALAAFAFPPNPPPGAIGFVLQSRARIDAMLGDREGAVDLLSRALANGAPFTVYLHRAGVRVPARLSPIHAARHAALTSRRQAQPPRRDDSAAPSI
jgi:hypothetical protein